MRHITDQSKPASKHIVATDEFTIHGDTLPHISVRDEYYIDIEEVARRLGVTTRTIKSWQRAGRIPYFPISRRTNRYRWSDIEEYLRRNFRR